MIDHKRKKIRYAIQGILVNAMTQAADRVFANRTHPVFNSELPLILIYTKEEQETEPVSPQDNLIERNLSLVIEACVQTSSKVDDAADDITKEIEDALAVDPSISGMANRTYLSKTEFEFNGQGEKIIGSMKLTYTVNYHTFPGE